MRPPWLEASLRVSLLLTVLLFSAGYATGGLFLVLLATMIEGIISRRVPWRRTSLDGLLAAFLAIFLLSGYRSEFKGIAVASAGLAAFTIYLAFGAFSRVLRDDPEFLRPLLWMWLGGGVFAAISAILRHLQSGLAATTAALGQNAVGTTMVVVMLIGVGLSITDRGWRRLAAAVIAVTAGAALIFSYTRGAWLGALAALALLMALGGRRAAAGLVTLGAVILVAGTIAPRGDRAALVSRARTILSTSANQDRIYLLRSGVAIARDYPVIGSGLGTFPFMYQRYRVPGDANPPDARPNAHNIYLNMAAEGGVLGLGAFLAILVQTLRLAMRGLQATPTADDRILRTAVLAAFTGILVHQLFDGTLISVHLGAGMWMLMAILTTGPSPHA